jgi:Lon protease-like protein
MADPTLQALPRVPLSTVLYPGALLPLRIFEVRYLDMIGRAHRDGTPFGVVSLTEGREVQQPAGPTGDGYANEAFHDVGTLAVVERLDRPHPGLFQILCRATHRFRLVRRERLKHGLWVGDAEVLPDDAPLEVPDDLEPVALMLRALLRELADRAGDDMPIPKPHRLEDCGWVANRWCDLLPVASVVKQRLLETDSPLLRLELVADLLERIRRQPAA